MRMLAAVYLSIAVWGTGVAAQEPQRRLQSAAETPDTAQQIVEVPQVTEQQPMSFWMARKLEFSKSLLESLTMGNFDKLAMDAKQMRFLGKIESFVRRKNADYRIQVKNFDTALAEVINSAEHGNITGATVGFNQMTTSCVACHALLREGVD